MLTSPTWATLRSESADALRGDGQTLLWHATDLSTTDGTGDWLIERQPDGARWDLRTAPADVTINGPARTLLLVLTRRIELTDQQAPGVTIEGDSDLVRHWVEHSAHVAD
jgi:hypothetical protein